VQGMMPLTTPLSSYTIIAPYGLCHLEPAFCMVPCTTCQSSWLPCSALHSFTVAP
jgi:hypothetical protein